VKLALQFTAIPAIDPATGRRYDALTQGTGGLNGQGVLDLVTNLDTNRGYGQGWLARRRHAAIAHRRRAARLGRLDHLGRTPRAG
jgi:hypothetical protein